MISPSNWRYKSLVGFLRVLMILIFKIQIHGLERLPLKGPAILVSNHQSYLDVPLIGCALVLRKIIWQAYWVIGKVTYASPFLHWFYSNCPAIVINGTVKKGESVLNNKFMIVIFPEGFYVWNKYKWIRQGKDLNTLERKIGTSAAILALKTGLPVIPIGLRGTEQALPPFKIFPKPGCLGVQVGLPIHLGKPEPEEVTDEMIAEKSKLIMNAIDALR